MAQLQSTYLTPYGRLRHALRGWISLYPSLYFPLVRGQKAFDGSTKVVQPSTEIVIEGFPRCGNSFAFAAFRLAQPREVNIAHHLHAAAQVVAAARRDLPTIVVIRPAEDAVASLLMRATHLSPSQAYGDYIRFYDRILPLRDKFVVAPFSQVTVDFGVVVDQVNQRFDTAFERFEHTEENIDRCFDYVESIAVAKGHDGPDLELKVARPSEEREHQKAEVKTRIRSVVASHQRLAADRLYERLTR